MIAQGSLVNATDSFDGPLGICIAGIRFQLDANATELFETVTQ